MKFTKEEEKLIEELKKRLTLQQLKRIHLFVIQAQINGNRDSYENIESFILNDIILCYSDQDPIDEILDWMQSYCDEIQIRNESKSDSNYKP